MESHHVRSGLVRSGQLLLLLHRSWMVPMMRFDDDEEEDGGGEGETSYKEFMDFSLSVIPSCFASLFGYFQINYFYLYMFLFYFYLFF